MKQLVQSLRTGKADVINVPVPSLRSGTVLVSTTASLISAGTERMVVEFAGRSLLGKARSRPDLVRQMIDKARREGVIQTLQAAFNRLEQPMALGYSTAGTIIAVGENVRGYQVGDRVACSGSGYAAHAEFDCVPTNLIAPIPNDVDFESAAFATVGAIAMHGFRLAEQQIGETTLVIGLGLLGLLAAQIARAAGCKVTGVDIDPGRLQLAGELGIQAVGRDAIEAMSASLTNGIGFDSVLICAESKSNDPVELAAKLARERARIVAVGAVAMDLPRKPYYEKELSIIVSRSYGPGRYDPNYEENGIDYPVGYIRWSENRNLVAFLDLLSNGSVNVQKMISHRFDIGNAADAYQVITGKKKEPFLGVMLNYPDLANKDAQKRVEMGKRAIVNLEKSVNVGVLGAGNYATATFLPVLAKNRDTQLIGIASASGLSASNAARQYGFQYAASSNQEILDDERVNAVAILTRHNLHANQIQEALAAGKHVYCEKPVAINFAELAKIQQSLVANEGTLLMAGFNRRFASLADRMKKFLDGSPEPVMFNYRVNAGYLPPTHWLHDPDVGGGRIIGEGCHFIDFVTYIAGSPVESVQATALPDQGTYQQDNVAITLKFMNGSAGTIFYLANGDKRLPKERVEVFRGGRVAILDDFRELALYHNGKRERVRESRQDKGHRSAWQAFTQALLETKTAPIPYSEIMNVSIATILARNSIQTGTEMWVREIEPGT
ncbi:MAG: Gfo/Idh/MocA family oxidoreductase [Anaerolineae bacterium]|nr:Gfo/Idh/MocA family oxidoreductase [Anaerolineae bacterium]